MGKFNLCFIYTMHVNLNFRIYKLFIEMNIIFG